MKRAIPFFALIIIAAAISYGISSGRHSEQSLPRPCSLDSLSGYLSLTPEQQRKVEPGFSEFAEKRIDIVNRRDEATKRLVLVLKSDKPTNKQIAEALKAVDVEQSRLRSLTAHHLLYLKSVLDEKQRDKLFDLVNKRSCVSDSQGSIACPTAKP